MTKNKKLFGLGCASLLCAGVGTANALQFEKAEVNSNLNAPLDASFEVGHLSSDQRQTLQVRKAPKDAYQRFDLERQAIVGQIELETGDTGSGPVTVHLSSEKPITRSVVSILAEVNTENGRYFHRYDLLINPARNADQKDQAEVGDEVSAKPPVADGDTSSKTTNADMADQNKEPSTTRKRGHIDVEPVEQYPGSDEPREHDNYGPIQEGETLWSIAEQLKPDNTTTPQMAVALYRATPKAFEGGISGLESGSYLTVPYAQNVRSINAAKARRKLQGSGS